jgi:hypothetical protein
VGRADDPLEREADRVADSVMGLGGRRAAAPFDSVGGTVAPGAVRDALDSHSDPLDPLARSALAPRFGNGLGHIRVHEGTAAVRAARSIGALAFAVGQSVVLGEPHTGGTRAGRLHLLAHEVAHVEQQQQARSAPVSVHVPATVRRQTPPSGGGSGGPAPRIVYLDNDVIGEIADGNPVAASRLRALKASGAEIRVTRYNYLETSRGWDPERTGARQLIVREYGIEIDDRGSMASRVATYAEAGLRKIDVQAKDLPMIATLREAEPGVELWAIDGGVRTNAPRLGVPIAPESNGLKTIGSAHRLSVRATLDQVGIHDWDVTAAGAPIRRPVTPTGGAAAGRPPRAPRSGTPAPTEPAAETASGEIGSGTRGGPSGAGPGGPGTGGPRTGGPPEVDVQHGVTTAAGGERQGPTAKRPAAAVIEAESTLEAMRRANAEGEALNTRIRGYMKTLGAVQTAMSYMEAVTTGLTVMAEGTSMPAAQREVDAALKQSQEAIPWAMYFTRPSTDEIIRLYTLKDAKALAEIAATCGSFSTAQHHRSREFRQLSAQLDDAAREYAMDAIKNYAESISTIREETASSFVQLITGDSERRLFGGLLNASENYKQAADHAWHTADDAEWIANLANNMLLAGFDSLTPRCDFLGQDCDEEHRRIEEARKAGQYMSDPWR